MNQSAAPIEGKRYFCVNVQRYAQDKKFDVYAPASIDAPKDHSVMFLMGKVGDRIGSFLGVSQCLIFWDEKIGVPEQVERNNAVVKAADARLAYCRFFLDNGINNLPVLEKADFIDGAFISSRAKIGAGVTIMPGAYVSGGCEIGDGTYIGCGVKLMGEIHIGKNVVIRENTVIGADGLSAYRYPDGTPATMPQFGGVTIEDDVQIGANTVIARGAIDDTVLEKGCKVDNSCFISHNVSLGQGTIVVGETILFGSAKTGKRVCISGNATVRNKAVIGEDAFIGMGAVVVKDVEPGATVIGNPARKR